MTYLTILLLACLLLPAAAPGVAAPSPATGTPVARVRMLDLRRMQPISGDAQTGASKAAVCAACHGARGVGIAPNFPNLAGQSATYLYIQLKEFHDGQRNDPVMTGQAATLSDADMRHLASYYATLAPKPNGLEITKPADANVTVCVAFPKPGALAVYVAFPLPPSACA